MARKSFKDIDIFAGIEEKKDGTRFEGHFHNGLKDGDFVEKDRNGNIVRQGTYRSGVLQ